MKTRADNRKEILMNGNEHEPIGGYREDELVNNSEKGEGNKSELYEVPTPPSPAAPNFDNMGEEDFQKWQEFMGTSYSKARVWISAEINRFGQQFLQSYEDPFTHKFVSVEEQKEKSQEEIDLLYRIVKGDLKLSEIKALKETKSNIYLLVVHYFGSTARGADSKKNLGITEISKSQLVDEQLRVPIESWTKYGVTPEEIRRQLNFDWESA